MLLQLEHFIDSQVGNTSQHTPDAQASARQMHKGWMEQRHYSDTQSITAGFTYRLLWAEDEAPDPAVRTYIKPWGYI